VGIEAVLLQDQGGGPQLVSYMVNKLGNVERDNSYSAYDLEVLAVSEAVKHFKCYDLEVLVVCEAVKHRRCYLAGCVKFLAISDHDTLRHLPMQANDRSTKRRARHVRDLQPFTGAITLVYRKGPSNGAGPSNRRVDFCAQHSLPLL
jgi:hypothetical protein